MKFENEYMLVQCQYPLYIIPGNLNTGYHIKYYMYKSNPQYILI